MGIDRLDLPSGQQRPHQGRDDTDGYRSISVVADTGCGRRLDCDIYALGLIVVCSICSALPEITFHLQPRHLPCEQHALHGSCSHFGRIRFNSAYPLHTPRAFPLVPLGLCRATLPGRNLEPKESDSVSASKALMTVTGMANASSGHSWCACS